MKRSLLLVSFFAMSLLLFSQERVYTPALRAPADSAVNQNPDVYLSWYAITGSLNLKYQVQLDTSALFNTPLKDTTLHLLTGYHTRYLTFNKKYFWRVRAMDNGNTSAWSPTRNFTVFNMLEFDSPKSPLPNDTALVPNTDLRWKNTVGGNTDTITGISNFDYQVDTTFNFNSPLLVSGTVSNSVHIYTTANLRFGTIYYWRVRAKHAFSTSAWSGNNWTVQKSNTSANLSSAFFYGSAGIGYAAGDAGIILSTSNGGTTWKTQVSGTTNNLKSICFINATLGLAVGDGGTIRRTKTGGTTWETDTSGTTNNLSSVHFQGPTKFYVAGNAGTIIRVTYAANKWTTTSLTSGTPSNLKGIYFVNATVGYAVGDNGTIIKTNGSDDAWTTLTSGTTKNLAGVYFINATTGFVVGSSGTILKTTNGGTNWSPVSSGTTNDLTSVSFPTSVTGFITGKNGLILKTNNGGSTWITLPAVTSFDLNSIFFSSSIIGYTVGQNGFIMSTALGGVPWSFKVVTRFIPTDPASGLTKQMLNVTLKSTSYTGLLDYEFDIADDENFTNIIYETESTKNTLNANYLRFGKKYFWRVRGRHLTDTSDWSATWNFTTINTVDLKVPSNGALNVSQKPQLRWTGQTGIAGFILQLGTDQSFTNPLINIKVLPTDTSYNVLLKLLSGTTYYWRMRAYSDGTLTADTSDWSPVWSFVTLGPAGINEATNPTYRLYPNPTSGNLYLEGYSAESGTVHFVLFDLLGKKIFEKDIALKQGENNKEIDLSGIKEGIYIARISSEGAKFNHKIIINR